MVLFRFFQRLQGKAPQTSIEKGQELGDDLTGDPQKVANFGFGKWDPRNGFREIDRCFGEIL